MSEHAPVLLVSAMQEESTPLVAGLSDRSRCVVDGLDVHRGSWNGLPTVLGIVGAGDMRAAGGARALVERFRPRRLILVGSAGGLSPELQVGDVLVARRVVDDRGETPAPDPDWPEGKAPAAQRGTVFCSRRILGTAEEKAAAYAAIGGIGPAVVDLESAAAARVAAEAGIPYNVVRAVSDEAAETLPLDFEAFRGPSGDLRRGEIVRHALIHPGVVSPLLGLRRRMEQVAQRLTAYLQRALKGNG